MAKKVEWVNPDLSPDDQELITEGINLRSRAKSMEDDAKALKSRGDELIHPILITNRAKGFDVPGVGKVVVKTASGSKISAEKLKIALLTKGVDITLIESAIQEATSTYATDYIEFKRSK